MIWSMPDDYFISFKRKLNWISYNCVGWRNNKTHLLCGSSMQLYVMRSKSLWDNGPKNPQLRILSLITSTVQLLRPSHMRWTSTVWFVFAFPVQSSSLMQHEAPMQSESPRTTFVTSMTFVSGHLRLSRDKTQPSALSVPRGSKTHKHTNVTLCLYSA